jgi:DNA (cytosine-5)-methyltransferase 1
VPEFVDWGPCHAVTGKPIKARKGEYFRAWLQALKAIGMRVDWKVVTCADYGDATTRERFFLYGRSDKKLAALAETTHAPRGAETDLLGTRKTWRSAAEIIDWSRPAPASSRASARW